jgi:DNA-binding transcriptional regulator YhcF (GntR family)
MAINELVTPLKRQTLSSDVYAQLRELLITGQMIPGEQISLRTTASALGVSVMPVREAVHRLLAEQALELTPNRALRVPLMTESAFREITRIRVNLEGLATEQAAQQLPSDALERIAALQDRFAAEMASASPDGARLIAFNKDFHFAVYGAAGMPLLLHRPHPQPRHALGLAPRERAGGGRPPCAPGRGPAPRRRASREAGAARRHRERGRLHRFGGRAGDGGQRVERREWAERTSFAR